MIHTNIIQGTPDWLEMRRSHITSTDAAIINGTNTFRGNTPFKLWQLKMGLIDSEPVTEVMTEGLSIEGVARNWVNRTSQANFVPAVVTSDLYPWAMASLDGYEETRDYIIEIKGGAKAYELAEKGEVPPYYYDQIQHALFVTGKEFCKYICYRTDKEPIVIDVPPNHCYIETLQDKEGEFYVSLSTMTPPPLGERDYLSIETEEANEIALKWKRAKGLLDDALAYEKECRALVLEETDDGSCIFTTAGVRVERINKQGSVDWKKVCVKWNINEADLEPFRKESIGYPRIVAIKRR